jgi:ribosomal protein L7/L12
MTVALSKQELCEAITLWLKSTGRHLVAVDTTLVSTPAECYVFKTRMVPDEERQREEETTAEVVRLLKANRTIEAIKYHRERTWGSLVESKNSVERIKRSHGL